MLRNLFGSKGEKPLSRADYSFGLEESVAIKKHLDKRRYSEVEERLNKLDSDTLSHVVDHLALNTRESALDHWQTSSVSAASALILGVYYAHKGWTYRGHGYASEVTQENGLNFHDLEKKALNLLEPLTDDTHYGTEACCRLIRVHMSLGHIPNAEESFEKCIAGDPLKTWAYIHYLEAIEPKWGGSREKVIALFGRLPESDLITSILTLKMLTDSLMTDQYIGPEGEDTDIRKALEQAIQAIDQLLDDRSPASVLRFILYNYLAALSQELGDEHLSKKYFSKIRNRYTLYPFGIMN